jgi:sugar lactone lactonase YvrE
LVVIALVAGCAKPPAARTQPVDEAALIAAVRAEKTQKIGSAEVAFTVEDPELLVEGIAYEAASGDFYVSSVHEKKIVRIGRDGVAHDFIPSAHEGIGGVLGIAVDARRRSVWAAAGTGVFELELGSGALRQKIELDAGHHLNDLVLDADGRVYLSDAKTGIVYSIDPGGPLEVFVPPGHFQSPQGLAWSADRRVLYVADYGKGLARVDRATRAVTWLRPESFLKGLDGLVRDGDTLIATQNGVAPPRVVRIYIDGDSARAETLLRNQPGMEEPTLGVLVDGDLVFVGAAQWDSFEPPKGSKPAPPHATPIFRLHLH